MILAYLIFAFSRVSFINFDTLLILVPPQFINPCKFIGNSKGSKIRNIRSAKGFGYGKFASILNLGMRDDIILKDFQSLGSV